jgi:hemolysin activation/secretion protein
VTESPFVVQRPLGFDPIWQAGAQAHLELRRTDRRQVPRRGVKLQASLNAYPGMLDLRGAYGSAHAEVNGYIPLIGDGPHLALRAGAQRVVGDVPAFDFASIGGRRTLRGFTSRRFAGDAAAYGGAELRTPLTRMKLLVEGELGVFALVDAGRVWVDGASPGGWHMGWGGGLWFDAFERAVSVAYATGERGKLYVWLGLPF